MLYIYILLYKSISFKNFNRKQKSHVIIYMCIFTCITFHRTRPVKQLEVVNLEKKNVEGTNYIDLIELTIHL